MITFYVKLQGNVRSTYSRPWHPNSSKNVQGPEKLIILLMELSSVKKIYKNMTCISTKIPCVLYSYICPLWKRDRGKLGWSLQITDLRHSTRHPSLRHQSCKQKNEVFLPRVWKASRRFSWSNIGVLASLRHKKHISTASLVLLVNWRQFLNYLSLHNKNLFYSKTHFQNKTICWLKLRNGWIMAIIPMHLTIRY